MILDYSMLMFEEGRLYMLRFCSGEPAIVYNSDARKDPPGTSEPITALDSIMSVPHFMASTNLQVH